MNKPFRVLWDSPSGYGNVGLYLYGSASAISRRISKASDMYRDYHCVPIAETDTLKEAEAVAKQRVHDELNLHVSGDYVSINFALLTDDDKIYADDGTVYDY